MKNKLKLILLCALISQSAFAQILETDILLFTAIPGSKRLYTQPENITNRKGYNNQPSFSADSKQILFSSILDEKQSEIWSYTIATKVKKQLTTTVESEFSPTFIQGGKAISAIRVDRDSSQHLYKYDVQNMIKPVMIPKTDSIGYSCWVNDKLVYMFMVGESNSLQSLNVGTESRTIIWNEPGRCIKVNPINKLVYFVDKSDSIAWKLTSINPENQKPSQVAIMPKGVEDFAFFSDGTMVTFASGQLVKLDFAEKKWIPMGEKALPTKRDCFRITISPDDKYIAIVAKRDTPPQKTDSTPQVTPEKKEVTPEVKPSEK